MKYKVGHDFKELLPRGWEKYIVAEADGYAILSKDNTVYIQGVRLTDLSSLKEAVLQIRFSTGKALNKTPLNTSLEFEDDEIYPCVAMPLDSEYLTTWVFKSQKGFEIFMSFILKMVFEAMSRHKE